ncbi:hypothetical protein AWB85_07985 [Mycobacteroides immunogenum]|uniref:DUF4352 domain-containing protein n=1 Tax=Mycobacteroides immunogenum TaxID=83262 RepID=A0A179VD10_9MYCO|nr:hypothetical protein [Mycobacteroides immunogenum]OAT68901.1 hypothetical protein AWB85_07985 [Mycobacteroides immunogenum]
MALTFTLIFIVLGIALILFGAAVLWTNRDESVHETTGEWNGKKLGSTSRAVTIILIGLASIVLGLVLPAVVIPKNSEHATPKSVRDPAQSAAPRGPYPDVPPVVTTSPRDLQTPATTDSPTHSTGSCSQPHGPWKLNSQGWQLIITRAVLAPELGGTLMLDLRFENSSKQGFSVDLDNFIAVSDPDGNQYVADRQSSSTVGYVNPNQFVPAEVYLSRPLDAAAKTLEVRFNVRSTDPFSFEEPMRTLSLCIPAPQ